MQAKFGGLNELSGWVKAVTCVLSATQFYLGKEDVERFEAAENEELQREILAHIARNLPVQTRTASGGKLVFILATYM